MKKTPVVLVLLLAISSLLITGCSVNGSSLPESAKDALDEKILYWVERHPEIPMSAEYNVVWAEKATSPQNDLLLGDSQEIWCVEVDNPLSGPAGLASHYLLGRYGNLWEANRIWDIDGEKLFLRVGCPGWE